MSLFNRNREHEEFERLSARVAPDLYNMALRLTRNVDGAKDLLQDALLRAFEKFHQFQTGSNFKAWSFRILFTIFYNQYKRQRKELRSVSLDQLIDQQDSTWEPRSWERTPEEWLLASMMDEPVERALRDLPNEYRDVVLLVDVQGLSYEDAAIALDVPIGTIRSRLFRGRLQLRSALREHAARLGYLDEGARP
ncbi:MAG: sigma-70 family RNA polymerase sigma factor [Armatimonadetes bacterium]|nr:sigma-70 family RNA polymerase sigma factor [Armatimonadota bacterium]